MTSEELCMNLEVKCQSIEILEMIIHFMYSRTISISDGSVLEVMITAQMYGVDDLVQVCQEHIAKQIQIDTVLPFIVQAFSHDVNFLSLKCDEYIKANIKEFVHSQKEQLLNLPKKVLAHILNLEFNGIEESEIFSLVKTWGLLRIQRLGEKHPDQTAPALKDVLSGLIECVRFVSLSKKFLQKEVMVHDLISYDMMIRILFQKAKDPTHLSSENSSSNGSNDDEGEDKLPLYLRPRASRWKTMDDFPSEEAYAVYMKSVLRGGMRVRAVHTYEHVLEGDTGEFVQWNTGFPPCQVRWRDYGSVYWLHWRDVAICE
jgi:hypothetical protein